MSNIPCSNLGLTCKKHVWLLVAVCILHGSLIDQVSAAQDQSWQILLDGFFRSGTKPLYLYARERQGKWIAVVGSSRDPDRDGRKTYNRSWYYADLSGIPITDGQIKGVFKLYITPDYWVPRDHKGYVITMTISATLNNQNQLKGEYEVIDISSDDISTREIGRRGKMTGTTREYSHPPQPDTLTYQCQLQGALVGGDPKFGGRCLVLWLGVQNGKLTSIIHGRLSQKNEVYSKQSVELNNQYITSNRDQIQARITIPSQTLDMIPCVYNLKINGRIVNQA